VGEIRWDITVLRGARLEGVLAGDGRHDAGHVQRASLDGGGDLSDQLVDRQVGSWAGSDEDGFVLALRGVERLVGDRGRGEVRHHATRVHHVRVELLVRRAVHLEHDVPLLERRVDQAEHRGVAKCAHLNFDDAAHYLAVVQAWVKRGSVVALLLVVAVLLLQMRRESTESDDCGCACTCQCAHSEDCGDVQEDGAAVIRLRLLVWLRGRGGFQVDVLHVCVVRVRVIHVSIEFACATARLWIGRDAVPIGE